MLVWSQFLRQKEKNSILKNICIAVAKTTVSTVHYCLGYTANIESKFTEWILLTFRVTPSGFTFKWSVLVNIAPLIFIYSLTDRLFNFPDQSDFVVVMLPCSHISAISLVISLRYDINELTKDPIKTEDQRCNWQDLYFIMEEWKFVCVRRVK